MKKELAIITLLVFTITIVSAACVNCPDFNNDGWITEYDTEAFVNCVYYDINCSLHNFDLNGDNITSIVGDVPCLPNQTNMSASEIDACKTCTPSCSGKECGNDGCGGSCGSCLSGEICQDGACRNTDDINCITSDKVLVELSEGSSKHVVIDGSEHILELITTTSPTTAKISVDGTTKSMTLGNSYVMTGGLVIYISGVEHPAYQGDERGATIKIGKGGECPQGCYQGECGLNESEMDCITSNKKELTVTYGTPQTVTIGSADHIVELITTTSPTTAKISVDGTTKYVTAGSSYTYLGGIMLFLKDVKHPAYQGNERSVTIKIGQGGSCPQGCFAGVCTTLSKEPFCVGMPEEYDLIYTKGTCENSTGTYTDHCQGDILYETYCGIEKFTGAIDYYCGYKIHNCTNGCQDGACLTNTYTQDGTYTMRAGELIKINSIEAEIKEISWATSGDTDPVVRIMDGAQLCRLKAGQFCKFFYGPVMAPYSYNLYVKVNSIEKNTQIPLESTASITVRAINETLTDPSEIVGQILNNLTNYANQIQNQTQTQVTNTSLKIELIDKNTSRIGSIEAVVNRSQNQIRIVIEGAEILSQLQLQEMEKKIYAQTTTGSQEIKVLPTDAIGKATKITNVESIEIQEYKGQAVYTIRGTKKTYLLFIIPITSEVEQKINVETGKVAHTNRPWWHFLALGI